MLCARLGRHDPRSVSEVESAPVGTEVRAVLRIGVERASRSLIVEISLTRRSSQIGPSFTPGITLQQQWFEAVRSGSVVEASEEGEHLGPGRRIFRAEGNFCTADRRARVQQPVNRLLGERSGGHVVKARCR